MSFSFSAKGKTKAEAVDAVTAELDKVVASQPVHAADKADVQDAAVKAINRLVDPVEGQVINLSVSGSLGWRNSEQTEFTSSNVSVYAGIAADSA